MEVEVEKEEVVKELITSVIFSFRPPRTFLLAITEYAEYACYSCGVEYIDD